MKRKKYLSKKTREKLDPFDSGFLYIVLILLTLGLVFMADISAPQALNDFGDKFYFFKSQLVWASLGVISMFVFSKINYNIWKKLSVPIFFLSVLFLIAVLIPGLGLKVLGARRWISVGGINFQPSEISKLAVILYLAKVLDSKNKPLLALIFPIVLVGGLIMLEPDLGTTLVILAIGAVQIFISGISWIHILMTISSGGLIILSLILASPYRRDRLLTFLSITSDPLGKDYHIRQILLAIGSGGIFGLGIGQSKQKFLFLPEAANDSIFAAIAEEIGFIGSLVIILLFAYFIIRGFKIVFNAPDIYSKSLAIGILTWIGMQTILNLAAMTSLAPLTGIPLPFFSYGGTSLVMILISCGILLNISRYATKKNTIRR